MQVADFYVQSEGAVQMDIANMTFAALPVMVVLMMGVVIVLLAVAFRSVAESVTALTVTL